MLFQDHLAFYKANEHDVNYFSGTFIIDRANHKLGLLVALKKSDGMIHATTTYHDRKLTPPQIVMSREFTPADFERFLVDFKKSIEANIVDSSLVEISYRRRTLDDAFTHFLEEDEKEFIHQLYLLGHLTGKSRSELYEQINEQIRKMVATRV